MRSESEVRDALAVLTAAATLSLKMPEHPIHMRLAGALEAVLWVSGKGGPFIELLERCRKFVEGDRVKPTRQPRRGATEMIAVGDRVKVSEEAIARRIWSRGSFKGVSTADRRGTVLAVSGATVRVRWDPPVGAVNGSGTVVATIFVERAREVR
jgi:hypothetical protein